MSQTTSNSPSQPQASGTPQTGTQAPPQTPTPTAQTSGAPTSNRGGRGRGRGGRGRGGGRGGSNATAAPAPAPAVAAPAGNRTQQNKVPTASSALPSITGWGAINVSVNRNETRERFATESIGFFDLIEQEYRALQSKHNQTGRLIPKALFKYYCSCAYWQRALFLKSKNDRLTSKEREALRMLENHHLGPLPERLHQYLMAMGNFSQGGMLFDWRQANVDFSGQVEGQRGFFEFGDDNNTDVRTTAATMWQYSMVPVPGVQVFDIQNELSLITHNDGRFRTLDRVRPMNPNTVGTQATTLRTSPNIVGWTVTHETALHSSWRSTYLNTLRWARDNLPPDTETDWLISPTSLRWVADRLSSIPDFKTKGCDSLTSTTAGHVIQMYWFEPLAADLVGQSPPLSIPYSQFFGQGLHSASSVPSDWLSPAFAFLFRFRRSHSSTNLGLSSPWYPFTADGAHAPLTLQARVGANVNISTAPRSFTLDAFSTVPERRTRILPHLYA
uniref:Coat protein n=1 Tax=Rhizoctonia solani partitivirus 19 TaxID=3162543 RepID=A0AAU6NDQ4_9VIRU